MTNPSAIVVGGGLADMVVARELALRGWRAVDRLRSLPLPSTWRVSAQNHCDRAFSAWKQDDQDIRDIQDDIPIDPPFREQRGLSCLGE